MVKSTSAEGCVAAAAPCRNHQTNGGNTRYISTTASELIISSLQSNREPVRLDRDTDISARQALQKRGQAKYLTNAMVLRLVDIADSKLNKAYWSTWHCSSILYKKGDKVTSKYCKQRWCIVCSRIRTALVIKKYLPAFETWENKVFVTLTVPNCSIEDLKETITLMKAAFERIRKQMENEYSRKKRANPLVGVRKLEVTYNADTNDYHPHFHLIMRDREVADDLRVRWLYEFTSSKWDAQNVKAADNGSCLELCKYFTKLISSQSKGKRLIHVDPLNAIFESVTGDRTFQPYRMPKVASDKTDEELDALAASLELDAVYEWSQSLTDWVEQSTGELLTGYQPDKKTRSLVETGIVRSDLALAAG